MKNYIVIAICVFVTAALADLLSKTGIDWINTMNTPDFEPKAKTIRIIWSILFILITISATILWSIKFKASKKKLKIRATILFFINAALTLLWLLIFFIWHQIIWAIITAIALALASAALVVSLWPLSRLAATLIIPYFLWITFETYLTILIYLLN